MLNKKEIIEKFGKKDGLDDIRYNEAVRMSLILDQPIFVMFEKLISLENKGLIKLSSEEEE